MKTSKESLTEMLAKWDAGQPIWTVELGGLGPGYEQAIQVAAIEMARDHNGSSLPDDDKAADDEWDRLCSATLHKHDETLGGLTGAQYGAARWLAYQWVHNGGPDRLIERAKEEGKDPIMVSKAFPHVREAIA